MSVPDVHLIEPLVEEPVRLNAISAAYERKVNLGNFESLTVAMIAWAKTRVPEGESFDLHDAKLRLRNMVRENVRAQLLVHQALAAGRLPEELFLGLAPPANSFSDPIYIRTVSVSLTRRVNLGGFNSVNPSYTDWADVRHVTQTPTELHIAIKRMWASLWANIQDELSRAAGNGPTDLYLGLPPIEVEDLTRSTV